MITTEKTAKAKQGQLHIEKALDVIDFTGRHHNTAAKGLKIASADGCSRNIYVANRYFCIETFDVKKIIGQEADGSTFLIYMFTDGEGVIRSGKDDIPVKKGDTYLIPASLGKFSIEGDVRFIKTYVPDMKSDVIQPLTDAGYSIERMTQDIDGIEAN